jgi:hypothetical protein
MMSKECLEHVSMNDKMAVFHSVWKYLLRHWTLARRQGGHVMDPRD